MTTGDAFDFINDLTGFYGARGHEVQDGLNASRVHIVRYTTLERQQRRRKEKRVSGHVVRPRTGHGELHTLVHDPAPINFQVALEMNELWITYYTKVVELDKNALTNIDLHGARVQVMRSTMPSYVGTSGICVRETTATLEIVTESSRHVFVPKVSADFGLVLPETEEPGGIVYLIGKLLKRRGNKRLKRFNTELDGCIG